jgi:molecular chaperone DnaK
VAALKSAMSSDDREDIERKTTELEQASNAIMQKMYEQSSGSAGAGGPSGGGADSGSAGHAPKDDVLDAEFEEVKDDRKKA